MEKGKELFAQKKWNDAASAFADELKKLSAAHGEHSVLCVPAYYQLANALYRQAEEDDDNVLGGKLSEKIDGEKKDKEEQEEKKKEEEGGGGAAAAAEGEEEQGGGAPEDNEEGEGKEDNNNNNNNEEDGDDDDDEDEDDEEEDDLYSLAWDNAEVARAILAKQDEGERDNELLADVYLLLAGIQSNNGKYEESIKDLYDCLAIRSKICPPSDKRLLEVHYQLAMSFVYVKKFFEPLVHYAQAAKICDLRLDEIKVDMEGDDFTKKSLVEEEFIELEEIKTELQEKIAEFSEGQSKVVQMLVDFLVGLTKETNDHSAAGIAKMIEQAKKKVEKEVLSSSSTAAAVNNGSNTTNDKPAAAAATTTATAATATSGGFNFNFASVSVIGSDVNNATAAASSSTTSVGFGNQSAALLAAAGPVKNLGVLGKRSRPKEDNSGTNNNNSSNGVGAASEKKSDDGGDSTGAAAAEKKPREE